MLCISNIDATPLIISRLYSKRWDIEVSYRYIKTLFNCKTLLSYNFNFIKQEIYAQFYIFVLSRLVENKVLQCMVYPAHRTQSIK